MLKRAATEASKQRLRRLRTLADVREIEHSEARDEPAASAREWRIGHARFEQRSGRLRIDGSQVVLDRSSRNLLLCLLRNPGETVGKDQLMRAGWPGRVVSENSLTKAIGRLRVALGDVDGDALRVVHGYGYRLTAEVEPIEPLLATEKPSYPVNVDEMATPAPAPAPGLAPPVLPGLRVGAWLPLLVVGLLALVSLAWLGWRAAPINAPGSEIPPGFQATDRPLLERVRRSTTSAAAFEQWVLARTRFNDDETENRRVRDAYRRAVELDPQFVDGWLGLADVLGHSGLYADSADEALAGKHAAMQAVDTAIRLDPTRADGYLLRGDLRYAHWWDWYGSEADLDKAAALGMGADSAYLLRMCRLRAALGRVPEAIALGRQATRAAVRPGGWHVLGYHLLSVGDFDSAQEALAEAIRQMPLDEHAHYYRGLIELLQGRPAQALPHFEASAHFLRLTGRAIANHELGNAAASERDLQVLISRYGHITPYQAAEVYAWRGENDEAMRWMERAFELHDASFMYLKFDPLLRKLRPDPRFQQLLVRVNLPPDRL